MAGRAPDRIRMPCSTRNVLILPQTTSYGNTTVTGVTSLITGLDHRDAPSAPQAHGCPVRVQPDCGDTLRAGKAWLGALLDPGNGVLLLPLLKVWSAPCLALDLLCMFSVMVRCIESASVNCSTASPVPPREERTQHNAQVKNESRQPE
eukprot:1087068-Rhodomonas_salina.1